MTALKQEYGVSQVASRVHQRLQQYLEAQYHIRDSSVIEERRRMLEEVGAISQRPYVEVTPSYALGKNFRDLEIPEPAANLLTELSELPKSIGVYSPYQHQSDGLEQFFGSRKKDLVVATGTGSGKTETFLYIILSMLAIEAEDRPQAFSHKGVRALLLYPMNALVSDQTARLRKLLGTASFRSIFDSRWGRHPRFGMYTSRTPYPGVQTSKKDGDRLGPIVGYYADLERSTEEDKKRLVDELKARGRFPAKDIQGFFNREAAVQRNNRNYGNWSQRFKTQPDDAELISRHEMLEHAPDLLVTNYSMLEYMLLRPLEAPIFEQTKEWLASDPNNQFLLIIDEAHMYRGVAGAEVGFLIRRLMSRLGITRDRMRCILTSASLGGSAEAIEQGVKFAEDLTATSPLRSFEVIRGLREIRKGSGKGSHDHAKALGYVSQEDLAAADVDPDKAYQNIANVANQIGWPEPGSIEDLGLLGLRQFVARNLTGFGPLELLIEKCSGNAREFSELAAELFPELDELEAEKACDGLLSLGTFARRFEPGREEQPILPTRVHLLFRGLPPVFACIDTNCQFKRHEPGNTSLLGRLFTSPRTQCECGSRVFELYTHRDCGVAYLKVYGLDTRADFFWQEQGGKLSSAGHPLHEFHVFLEEPHPQQLHKGDVVPIWIEIRTGKVYRQQPSDLGGMRRCFVPALPIGIEDNLSTFNNCPSCLRRTDAQKRLKIMDLATKGEQPFANLVREQFVCQVPTKEFNDRHPNAGRKALLFSDGRQRAARLARDLPREVERDSLREALVLATKWLNDLGKPALLDSTVYTAFVAVCSKFNLNFFDRVDQERLRTDCLRFEKQYDDLADALDDEWEPMAPERFRLGLLRQISDPYYSLVSACAAVVQPVKNRIARVSRRLESIGATEMVEEIILLWVGEMLKKQCFDPAVATTARQREFAYFEPVNATDDLKQFFKRIGDRCSLDSQAVAKVREELFDGFAVSSSSTDDSGSYLVPKYLELKLTLDDTWQQCGLCGNLQLFALRGACTNCGEKTLREILPDDPYMVARKGFFRDQLHGVLNGQRPLHITAEEHTAQLSHRDNADVYATTERFELRFQDVPLGDHEPPVDVLSCTTTMEVGIDIGSLTAVGLRTVPPQRENYQQRAGRAGRRGTSVSSVVTYAQGGAHDSYYFENPKEMISGEPRQPKIKIDNPRLAKRHVNSFLLQTYFYEQLDNLSPTEKSELTRARPDLLSAFGKPAEFLLETGNFTLDRFQNWIEIQSNGSEGSAFKTVVGWLPEEVVGEGRVWPTREVFVSETAKELLKKLIEIKAKFLSDHQQNQAAEGVVAGEDQSDSLLDLFFDHGLLPSYAFPTDLTSFVIQQLSNDRLKTLEQPQMAKNQALTEYAPGRLLVVNKQTYRVGGIFFRNAMTSAPAKGFFAQTFPNYVGCVQCTYVRLEEEGVEPQGFTGDFCPVCDNLLYAYQMMNPPDFSPEGGKPVREGDTEQDMTYATAAELPEVIDQLDFQWLPQTNSRLRVAFREGVKMLVVNKGEHKQGFSFCESCGAGRLTNRETEDGARTHKRPFLLPRHILARESATWQCHGNFRDGLFLGNEFLTDVLLVRITINDPIDFDLERPWLRDALTTFAEALALGASLYLDIDPGEISAGFKFLPMDEDTKGLVEIFLYDTASGGAGYAFETGKNIEAVLERAGELLESCSNPDCETSCTACLRHYGNRFLHTRLNRKLGLDILMYSVAGRTPTFASVGEQARQLASLSRYLELDGWAVTSPGNKSGLEVPMIANSPNRKEIVVGVHPAMLSSADARRISPLASVATHLLPDYVVSNDLPAAFQSVAITGDFGNVRGINVSVGLDDSLPTYLLDDLSDVNREAVLPDGHFNIKVNGPELIHLGISPGTVLLLQGGFELTDRKTSGVLILNRNGQFKATESVWTIADAKEVRIEEILNVLIYYGRREERFRPEKFATDSIDFFGTLIGTVES